MNQEKFKIPTEIINLPSKGLIYPKDNKLSLGHVELKYPTAQSEDILTNQNYIKDDIVLDKFLESLIVSDINPDDLIIGDKNALLISARILGYGSNYRCRVVEKGKLIDKDINLSELPIKNIEPNDLISEGKNEFKFTLPSTQTEITYRLLTSNDEKNITKELKELEKLFPNKPLPEVSLRFIYMITSVNGDNSPKTIREFVNTALLLSDAKAFRAEIKRISPEVVLEYKQEGEEEGTPIPISFNFFYPEL